jgi:hypothetical protein
VTTGTRRAGLGLALLVAFHMREALFARRVYFERDLHLQWYGQVQSFVAALAAGAWPLWDPWVGFGQPLLANANAQLLYPPTWLNLLVQPGTYYTLYLLGHLLLAALGAFLLSRRWGVSQAGSFVAAGLWVSSGPLLSLGNVWNHLAGAALLPFLLLAVEAVVHEGGRRTLVVLAAVIALAVLAGSPDFLLLAAVPVGALLWPRSASPQAPLAARVGRLAAAAALGAGLCAAQLLPSLELVLGSSRAHLPAAVRGYWSVHPWVSLQALVPLAWNGLAWRPERRALWFDSREPYLFSLYLGVPALALAALGLAKSAHARRWLLLATAGFGLLFALGQHTPVYEALVLLAPPLRLIRYPAKGMVLVAFAAAMLAGAGFERWRRGPSRAVTGALVGLAGILGAVAAALWADPTRLEGLVVGSPAPLLAALGRAAGLAVALGGLAALARRRASWAAPGALAVAALGLLDLAVAHRDLNPTAPGDFYRVRPAVLKALDPGPRGRLLTFDYTMAPGLSEALLHRDRPYMVAAEPGSRNLWRGAMGVRLYPVAPVTGGFFVYGSFGRDFLGIQPEPVTRLNDFATERMQAPEWPRLLALAGVTQLVTLHDGALGPTAPRQRFRGPFFEDERLYDVPDALPRCHVVSGARLGDDPGLLLAPDFDPRREVLLAGEPTRAAVPDFVGRCGIRRLEADRVVLETEASAPAFAVLADAWDPAWRAALDGRDTGLLRANVAFRAVAVGAGRHEVTLLYRPRSVVLGAWLSAASLLLAAALWIRAGRTRPA